jgi:hypothetical protein
MAAMPSSFTRFQPSSPGTRVQPDVLVTTVTQRRQFPSGQPAPRVNSLFTLPKEPEDAPLTGGTRSLDRRLLALNVSGSLAKRGVAPERGGDPLRSAVA